MPMNVLVTNDDGIESPGLWALARAAQGVAAYVYVVAPSVNQSAVGAGFTLRRELTWTRVAEPPAAGVEAWHVDGTPADCVAIALDRIVDRPIDLILSGVNFGANIGQDVLASGTVGGALQGHLRGIPAMAVSEAVGDAAAAPEEIDWSVTERVAALLCHAQADGVFRTPVFLNVNVPRVPFEELAGILVTRMGRRGYIKLMELHGNSGILERDQPDFHTNPDTPPGTDIWALAHHYVSVTPLQSNLTDHRLLDLLGERLNAAF